MSDPTTWLDAIAKILSGAPRRGPVHYVDLAAAVGERWPDAFGLTDARRSPQNTVWVRLRDSEDYAPLGGGRYLPTAWAGAEAEPPLQLSSDGGSALRKGSSQLRRKRLEEGSIGAVLVDPDRRVEEVRRRSEAIDAARVLLVAGELGEEEITQLMHHWSASGARESGVTLRNRFAPAFMGMYARAYMEQAQTFNEWVQALMKAEERDVPGVLDELWARQDLTMAGSILPTMILHTRDPERWFPWTSLLARGLLVAGSSLDDAMRADASAAGFEAYCAGVVEYVHAEGLSPHLADLALAYEARSAESAKPKSPRPQTVGFSADTFRLLVEIRDQPAADKDWFASRKPTYKRAVRRPLQVLLEAAAKQVVDPLLNKALGPGAVVTQSKRLLARVYRRQPLPDGSIYLPYLWGAFFLSAHERKNDAVQLFVDVHTHGVAVGVALRGNEEQAPDRVRALAEAGHPVLEHQLAQRDVLLAIGNAETGELSRSVPAKSVADLAALASPDRPALELQFTPEEACDEGFEDRVVDAFRFMTPFFAACATDQLDDVLAVLGLQDSVEAEDDEDDEDDEYTIKAIAERTFLALPFLERVKRAAVLGDGRDQLGQVVLYGPPGTGKTFIAEQLALSIVGGDRERVHLVQFHPAYSYEHFIEGFRPRVHKRADGDSKVVWELEEGVLLDVVRRIQAEGRRHVLIIDEMNRGDLPTILGELMYLLSRRDDKMASACLARSRIKLSLPRQLSIIGTMNTSDRSIAHIDFALRRRFRFFGLRPDGAVIADYRSATYGDEDPSHDAALSSLLTSVNADLLEHTQGAGLQIGHSYLLDVGNEAELKEVWEAEILPLIEDFLDFDSHRLADFRWLAISARYKKHRQETGT